jgi:hypothetical protein
MTVVNEELVFASEETADTDGLSGSNASDCSCAGTGDGVDPVSIGSGLVSPLLGAEALVLFPETGFDC